ncbi:MAG TPA: hypothetical protein VF884_08820 [Nitrososphaeraceae archaeon]
MEILPLEGNRFKNWIRKIVKKEYDLIVGSQVIEEITDTLRADAEFDRQTKELGLRFSMTEDKELRWFYVLANDKYCFIEITTEAWNNINYSPDIFFSDWNCVVIIIF